MKKVLCCACKKPIASKDLTKVFDEKILELYKELKEYRESREYEKEILVEFNSKEIKKLEQEIPFLENTKCSSCREPVHKGELFTLDCSHEFHRGCLKNCIEIVSLGKIFLTKEEKSTTPIECIVCQKEITDAKIEQVFDSFPDMIKIYKERREERKDRTESINDDMEYTLSCCNKKILTEDTSKKLEGAKFFSKKRNKLITCLCPYCKKNMAVDDLMIIFSNEIEVILSTLCGHCIESLENKKIKASCNIHYFCQNCSKKKECNVCEQILNNKQPKQKRNKPEDPYIITCERCKVQTSPHKGSLLYCYHFLCKECTSSNKENKCPTCLEVRKAIKFCKCKKDRDRRVQIIQRGLDSIFVIICEHCEHPICHNEELEAFFDFKSLFKKYKDASYLFNIDS